MQTETPSLTPATPTAPTPSATLADWRTPPHITWAFRHVRDFMPVADIANDSANVEALPSQAAALDAFSVRAPDGASLDLARFQHATRTDALMVLHRGQVVHTFLADGMTARTPHILMSASKSVVGLVAGILQARGDLDVDALVSALMPATANVANTAYAGATVRDLLDMRTGVAFDDATQRAYNAATHWEPPVEGGPPADLRAFFTNATAPAARHGGAFKYMSANTDLLGLVIEATTGRPFATLASELLWKPMGAQDAASVTVDAKGAPRCTGGLCATLGDLARVGQLVAQDGRRAGAQIVPVDWLEDIWRGGDRAAWNNGEFASSFGGMPMSYRSGWYVMHHEPETVFAMGIHGQHLFVDRKNQIVVAKLSSQEAPLDPQATGLTLQALRAFRRCLIT